MKEFTRALAIKLIDSIKMKQVKRLLYVLFSLFLFLGIFTTIIVKAQSGDVLSAWAEVIPTIDGILSTGEWDDADSVSFLLTFPEETHPVTLWVKNDDQFLYLAVEVLGDDQHPQDGVFFHFDNDNDGSVEQGDDWLIVVSGTEGEGHAIDGFVSGTNGLRKDYDTSYDGTNDILGASSHTNVGGIGDYSFELRHPLDTTDDAHDFSLTLNDVVGVQLECDDAIPGGAVPRYWPSSGSFAEILIAERANSEPTPPPNKKPTAYAGPDQTAYTGETVDFSGAESYDSDGTIVSYEWDFGDGETDSGVEVSHSYSEPDSYTVTLTVVDDKGAKDTETCVVTVTEVPPDTGTLSISTTPVNRLVFVDGNSWGIAPVSQEVEVATYTVSFGVMTGYTTPADQVAVVTVNTITTILGTYVLITPETGTLSIDTTPVKGTVTVNGDPWGIAPQSRDVEIGTYTVTYGDMTGYTRPNPVSANVAADETERVLGIYIEKLEPEPEPEHPNAIFTNSPDEPVVNQIITFDASASSDPDGTIVGYEWDFDDGTTRMGMEITHAYDDAGTYTVTLTVTDDDGLTDTTSTIIEVIVQEPPEATFSYHPSDPKEGDTVTFDASDSYDSDGDITSYAWLFGDGDSGEGMNVVHVYDEAATYTVTLTVTDNDGLKDTATKPIRIDPEPKTFSWLTTEVVLAIIGVIGTFITAYFGYRAVTARSQKT